MLDHYLSLLYVHVMLHLFDILVTFFKTGRDALFPYFSSMVNGKLQQTMVGNKED